jgi:hypothetical protein
MVTCTRNNNGLAFLCVGRIVMYRIEKNRGPWNPIMCRGPEEGKLLNFVAHELGN